MRLIVALCTVEYSGRLSTVLTPAVRAIIIKSDGSVTVHSDDKGLTSSPPLRKGIPNYNC